MLIVVAELVPLGCLLSSSPPRYERGWPAPAGCSPYRIRTSTSRSPDSSLAIHRRSSCLCFAAVADDVRPATLGHELAIMAEADLSDLLPYLAVPTLLFCGHLDVRSPLSIARQFEEAVPQTGVPRDRGQAT